MIKVMIAVFFLAGAASALGSEIYRCEGEDGSTVFSQQPCGDDADTVRLGGGTDRIGGDAIQSAETDAEIRAVCRQAMTNMMDFVAHRARELSAEGQSEFADMLGEAADGGIAVTNEDIDACHSDWSIPRYREGWQCLAAATTHQARQDCMLSDLNQMFALP